MVYLILIDENNNNTLGGIFATMDDAVAAGEKDTSADFNTVTDFSEVCGTAQVSIYNDLVSRFDNLNAQQVSKFSSKTEGNDRITHAISKLSVEQIDSLGAKPKKRKERKARELAGKISISSSANSDDKIWRKSSLRFSALQWLKDNMDAHNGQIPLAVAINDIAAAKGITTAQVRGLLDKLRGVNAIKVNK